MHNTTSNIDPREVSKFEESATRWWDLNGEFKPLHEINPLRLASIDERMPLAGKRVADVGCGGGILAESMAACGAMVTGIDASGAALTVAKLHALETGVQVDYRQMTAEQLAHEAPGSFDAVTCMEMLEHVPDPAAVIAACATLVKPGGQVFLSTLNRNPISYLSAVIGAEYVLGLLPKGTHDYARFIRPSELDAWLRAAGLSLQNLSGLHYNPVTRRYALGRDVSVNYLAHAIKGEG